MNVGNSVSDQFPFGKLLETVYLDDSRSGNC